VDKLDFIVDKCERIVDNLNFPVDNMVSILTMPLCPTHKENFLLYIRCREPQKMLAKRESPA
jgi:hypothetical protein